MWYVSFHGSSDDGGNFVNNIWSYDDEGNLSQKNVLPTVVGLPLLELRAFQFVANRLFVVNANNKLNQVLAYEDTGNEQFEFIAVYASSKAVDSILHPYDLTFAINGNCYVSSQDTNVVTGLSGVNTALPVASCLTARYPNPENFYQGTFVASSQTSLSNAPIPYPSNVPQPQGLALSGKTGKSDPLLHVENSVRGILAHKDYLYVSDEVANSVKMYKLTTGAYCGQIGGRHLQAPVQLLLNDETLYIGSSGNDKICSYAIPDGTPQKNAKAEVFIDKDVKHVSGMAFDAQGNFYAAERKDKRIMRFDADGGDATVFISDLPDYPEFIRYRD